MDGQNTNQSSTPPVNPETPQPVQETPVAPPQPQAALSPAEPQAPTPGNPPTLDSTTPIPSTDATSSPQTGVGSPTPPQPPLPETTPTTPPVPTQPDSKGGMKPWMIISFVLLAVVLVGSAYFYMLSKNQSKEPTVMMYPKPTKAVATPTLSVSLTPSPSSSQSAGKGTVSGTVCYPASGIPAGTITAKDVTTSKEYTQAYAGIAAGASATYTFDLPVGMYHLKFTPTQYATTIGYYTDYSTCVGNPTGTNCTGQKVRPMLSATVTASGTVQNVNLCDYYYPANTPPQF